MPVNTVWIAYVTTGCEKYKTTIVGTFTKRYLACRAVFDYLCKENHIFSFREVEEVQNEYVTARPEMMRRTRSAHVYLKTCVDKYNDGYYGNGWDYTIEKQTVRNEYFEPEENIPDSEEDEEMQLALESSLTRKRERDPSARGCDDLQHQSSPGLFRYATVG